MESKFQSTRPRGARRQRGMDQGGRDIVSIHAPAWGATRALPSTSSRKGRFNPRARVGRDAAGQFARWGLQRVSIHAPAWGATMRPVPGTGDVGRFQSTRPRGARHQTRSGRWPVRVCFNPRARVGRDQIPPRTVTARTCFNPRARVGRDTLDSGALRVARMFQSTRPRGARQPHHNSLRDKDFFRVTREPMLSLDPKGTGQVAATQKPMKSISC